MVTKFVALLLVIEIVIDLLWLKTCVKCVSFCMYHMIRIVTNLFSLCLIFAAHIGIIYLLSGLGGSILSSLFFEIAFPLVLLVFFLAFSVQCFRSLLPTGLSIATKLVVCKFWSAAYLSVHKVGYIIA